ncbi:VCBS repeat-containing protein [Robertkochia flava]|uniref:VCBS repeat-containing protein n=1 Tax=Robertkochia flava TaxID=3447986 RepID=UPI001CCDD221|nr:VCBS repeat-containing protein [Robertkochia marina]
MRTLLIRHIYLVLTLALLGCKEDPSVWSYLDSRETGISFSNSVKNTEELNILNYLYFYNGAGVAAADFNNDGFIDLYFTANKNSDALYLNKGAMTFEEVTDQAGIKNNTGWTTGVATADVDGNGFPDLYISKVAPLSPEGTHNLLYLNQGPDEHGIPEFLEAAAAYGLDFKGYSTQAAFFDQDLDGDLDMFLLNHSVHPNQNYGRGTLRDIPDSLSGDRFFRNHDGYFRDETTLSGIHSGKIGYGLGISTGDLNQDGYPDLYIGNDFFENDYLYMNQGDGTFRDVNLNTEVLGHTSHFSMGNAIGDINNDQLPDVFSVDMLPEDLTTYKKSGLEFPYQIYSNYLKNGYQPQFMQNTLHLNTGRIQFKETAHLSGVAASEWSWSALLEDLDNDGYRDIFITNGIPGATNDMDFVNFIANEEIQKKLGADMGKDELNFIRQLPEKRTANYVLLNNGQKRFLKNRIWNQHPPSFSNGAITADLDNDNDLDLVVNNLNEGAFIIRNDLNTGNSIAVKFHGKGRNTMGIGARLLAYLPDGRTLLAENYTTRGYLSSQPAIVHLGTGQHTAIDSLRILWPDGSSEVRLNVPVNTQVLFKQENAVKQGFLQPALPPSLVQKVDISLEYEHIDQGSLEFNHNPLIPFASTNLGPSVETGDLNNDGLTDLCFGGGKKQETTVYLQTFEGAFQKMEIPSFEADAICEDTDQLIFDANGDHQNDILIVSGGNEFKAGIPLQPRLYIRSGKNFTKKEDAFQNLELNASSVSNADIDRDGDQDILITSNLVPLEFGKTPKQYLLSNDGKGYFKDITDSYAPELRGIGNIQDAAWEDLNHDGLPDLVVAGHWGPISVFINTGNGLELQTNTGLENASGWWNTVKIVDLDLDGDLDLVAGNWGENTRLTASAEEPIKLYRKDMDDNGSIETIVSHFYQGVETPFSSKDELAKQMPFLNKKYLSYKKFAEAGMAELFGREHLNNAEIREVKELRSCYFINNGEGTFSLRTLPFDAQTSCINDIAVSDLNKDGYPDLILTGNLFEVSTQLGRADSNRGTLLINDGKGNFIEGGDAGLHGAMRKIVPLSIGSEPYWIITRNNQTPLFIEPSKLKNYDHKK